MRVDIFNSGILPKAVPDVTPGAVAKTDDMEATNSPSPPAVPAPPAPTPSGTNAGQEESADDNKELSLLERILARGFSQFAEDIKAEKRAKMREEILAAMGLAEDDLKNMPAEQRQVIEDMVSEEIKRRMEAAAEMDGHEKAQTTMPYRGDAGTLSVDGPGAHGGAHGGAQNGTALGLGQPANMGLGPLLALQEIDAQRTGEMRKNGVEESGGEPGKKDHEAV